MVRDREKRIDFELLKFIILNWKNFSATEIAEKANEQFDRPWLLEPADVNKAVMLVKLRVDQEIKDALRQSDHERGAEILNKSDHILGQKKRGRKAKINRNFVALPHSSDSCLS